MISLHELYGRGGDVEKAVMDFGHLHTGPTGGEVDWNLAERHWTRLVDRILRNAGPAPHSTPRQLLRRAENAGVTFLLTLAITAGYRCPICCTTAADPG
ncbi:hypothetical protein ACFWXO_44875 [Kitasatospora sp. NPDC059088]|uniref:hypothetical protein n=1 Tax=Kitasatospora sp. NPDC059088 TaxID=3346722 RepID=UPI0036BD988A